MNFQYNLAWELIDNPILNQNEAAVTESMWMLCNEHKHLNAPTHLECFRRGKWEHSNKQPYQQYKYRTSGCN